MRRKYAIFLLIIIKFLLRNILKYLFGLPFGSNQKKDKYLYFFVLLKSS